MDWNARPLRLSTSDDGFEAAFKGRLHVSEEANAAIEKQVQDIVAQVRLRGDAAILEYTARWDHVQAASMAELELTQAELKAAFDSLPEKQRAALAAAAARVRSYHEAQKRASGESWSYRDEDGTLLGQKVTPIDRAGIYVPGGKAAYPSSVLMNAIPAHVAGVPEIIMVCPTPRGERNPLVLAAAYVAGVTRVFAIGGAQAVAALAYGTQTIPAVDKITGPGNDYVAEAKRQVFGKVGIDMIAGPSEILVIADGTTPPDWVAMDLFSQAEHDEVAQSILLCPDAAYIDKVQAEIDRLLPEMPRAEIISKSLNGRGALIHTRSMAWKRPVRSATASRRSTSRSRAATRTSGSRCSSMPARSSWAASRASRLATTAPAPTTCCPPAAPRAFPARWASTTSRNAAASSK
jgi:histidinol dehydrogenase